jgi:hypothetical protein
MPQRLLIIVCVATTYCAAQANTDPVYRKLRDAVPSEAFLVENLELKRDVGVFRLRQGRIAFTPPIDGRSVSGIFIGDGEFTIDPALPIEKEHLRRITEKDTFAETMEQVLLSFTDKTYEEVKAGGKPAPVTAQDAREYQDFRRRLRQNHEAPRTIMEGMLASDDMENIDAELLVELLNPKRPGTFTAYIRGRKRNDLRFFVTPRGAMRGLPAPEEVALVNVDLSNKEDGVLYLCHTFEELKKGEFNAHEEKRVAASLSYRIVTTIAGNNRLAASAEIEFVPLTNGDRVFRFGLLPTLRVSRVSQDGKEMAFVQEDRRQDAGFYIILPAPATAMRAQKILVEYSGDKVIRGGGGG